MPNQAYHLYIRAADADAYRAYLCSEVLNQTSVPAPIRIAAAAAVYSSCR